MPSSKRQEEENQHMSLFKHLLFGSIWYLSVLLTGGHQICMLFTIFLLNNFLDAKFVRDVIFF
jgi:hypothetical protein